VDQTFEAFWEANKPQTDNIKVVMPTLKEVARRAWENGFDAGWDTCGGVLDWGND